MNLLRLPKLNLAACFLLMTLLPFSAQAISLTPSEQQWIKDHPQITLGSDYNWPPYDFEDNNGKHKGISADILDRIRETTGLEINIKSGVWSRILEQAEQGTIDGLACAVKTPDRAEKFYFTPPIPTCRLAFLCKKAP